MFEVRLPPPFSVFYGSLSLSCQQYHFNEASVSTSSNYNMCSVDLGYANGVVQARDPVVGHPTQLARWCVSSVLVPRGLGLLSAQS